MKIGESMLIKKENITQEQLDTAYKYLKEYCDENNENIIKFLNDDNNIQPASEYIHKQLNFALRLVLKPKKIEEMIRENKEFIFNAAKERYDEENPPVKQKKSNKIKEHDALLNF